MYWISFLVARALRAAGRHEGGAIAWHVALALCFIGGCAGDAEPADFYFTDVRCLPDVDAGETVVAGQRVSCWFRVAGGQEGREVVLRCKQPALDIDCDSPALELGPRGPGPLPIEDGRFAMETRYLAGTTAVVTWFADTGRERASHLLEIPVVADDGIDEPPSIDIDCAGAGDDDTVVRIPAGDTLRCALRIRDPDPGDLYWTYDIAQDEVPAHTPMPLGGAAPAPVQAAWSWTTAPGEAGTSWTFTFVVSDGRTPEVKRDLVVVVDP